MEWMDQQYDSSVFKHPWDEYGSTSLFGQNPLLEMDEKDQKT
jgi:hypothetical protein